MRTLERRMAMGYEAATKVYLATGKFQRMVHLFRVTPRGEESAVGLLKADTLEEDMVIVEGVAAGYKPDFALFVSEADVADKEVDGPLLAQPVRSVAFTIQGWERARPERSVWLIAKIVKVDTDAGQVTTLASPTFKESEYVEGGDTNLLRDALVRAQGKE